MIRYNEETKTFYLETKNTTYAMRVVYEKYLVHLYYGKKTHRVDEDYKELPLSFAPYPADVGVNFSLDTMPTELSFFDCGDKRDTGIKIRNSNGDSVTFFRYCGYRIFNGRKEIAGMPFSRNGDETLEITYFDDVSQCELRSYYTVYYDNDCIIRHVKLENKGKTPLVVESLLFFQLELPKTEKYSRVTLCGTYDNERHICEEPICMGKQSIYSERGHSSHQFNPFLILKKEGANEYNGEAYACEFVYSGDFEMQTEKCFDGRIRVLAGMNRNTFAWYLEPKEVFNSPEMILTFSGEGLTKLSQNLHKHIKGNIIPERFVERERPVVYILI